MRAKICGITRLEDAQLVSAQGAWALGFNFYSASPRYVEPKQVRHIIAQLSQPIVKVGVVIGYSEDEQLSLMHALQLDYLQVYTHVSRPVEVMQRMILALQLDSESALPPYSVLRSYGAILLDAPKQADGLYGGTGRTCDWDMAARLAKAVPLILAGGLHPQNITQAVQAVHPYAVDVASGVEREPGIKDPGLISQFLEECRHVN